MFLKQFTGFSIKKKLVQYGSHPQILLLCLAGSVPIKYQNQSFNIPIYIILPQNFPYDRPKVYLAFQLDDSSQGSNPLIKGNNEVMNNYIFKWQGNSQQYNLGGLCFNLSKSFNMYPPLGKAG
jgi:hypothetical protein